ncbi:carboxypeptidase regulatory-like domain-containing protein [Paludibacter sp. 221]|uniref:carboxypeptidase regulatory-like domain-containing protein n=1 Tax=Paludibacter sp. 221 TaxID=2302939 RepID=UPI0013D71E18|nr:carboxypeptidase regulatory-like domain-containing protein [Paludibacter sp. 221]
MKNIFKLLLISLLILNAACTKNEVNLYGDIRGFVTNTVTGEPIRNANVKLLPGGNTTNTGSDGSYEFKNLSAGQYTVQVMSTNYQSNTKGVTVYAGEINQCDIPLTPGSGILEIQNPNAYFGTNNKSLSVTLKNIGKETLEWYVDYNADWIVSVSPAQGKIQENGVAIITIRIDRTKIPENAERSTTITVVSNGGNVPIYVSVNGSTNPGNASNVVRNGMYAYYTFESDTKNLISGKGKNGSIINTGNYITGSPDGSKALELQNDGYLNIPEGMIDKELFSISFWVKGIADGHIFHVGAGGSNSAFNLNMHDGKLKFGVVSYYYTYTPSFSHKNITDDSWHMITLTSDCRKTKSDYITTSLYIDGEMADVVSERFYIGGDDYNAGVKFVLGGENTINNSLLFPSISGLQIDNLRIYNTRVLTELEVMQIYQAEGGL